MKKIFLLSIVLLSFSIQGMSQKVERYKGKMKIPTEIEHMKGLVANLSPASRPSVDGTGGGWYDYYVDSQGRRIKHGDFVYRSGNDVYYSEMSEIHGHFLHGKKSGKWTLRQLKENGTYDDKSFYLEVNYKNDTLNGPYTLKGDFFRTEYATGKFCNGHLCGDIYMKNDGNVISMSVGNDGLPVSCRITDNSGIPITQYRVFKKGALILLYEEDKSTGETNYIYFPFDTLRWVKGGILPTRDSVFDEQDVVFHGNSCAKIKQVARNQIIEKCQVRNFGVEYESEVLPDILSKLGARLDGWDLTYTPIPVSRKTTKKTPQKTPQVTTHSEKGNVKIHFNLCGRKLIKTAYPPDIFERDTIVVKIIVNQDGRVVGWNAPFDESTKEYDAIESALGSTFFDGVEYPTNQIGKIIYYFKKD